jgi:hypothetical protein
MKKFIQSTFILLITLISCTTSTNADDKKPLTSSLNGGKVTWYDGKEQKSAILLSDFLLEVVGSSGESKMKSIDKNATTAMDGRRYKVHKLTDPTIKASISKGAIPDSVKKSGNFLPVFSENGSESHLMVPVGNIIVQLESSYDESKAKSWASENGLRILNKLSFGNFYLIESPAGFYAIDLANSLVGKKGVLSATPEWWTNHGLR